MKEVLISIRPKWCELIASGEKTVEVRKTKPKLEPPFKVYIYCTIGDGAKGDRLVPSGIACGKVIGEFVCDRICYVRNYGSCVDIYDFIASCLSAYELIKYATDKNGNVVYPYGWHISGLVIYEKPKELSEFYKVGYRETRDGVYGWTTEEEKSWQIKRPPQSWCYVEEQK